MFFSDFILPTAILIDNTHGFHYAACVSYRFVTGVNFENEAGAPENETFSQ